MRVLVRTAILACALGIVVAGAAPHDPFTLDRAGQRWVDETFRKLTLDEKVGQLIVASLQSDFVSTDSDTFEQLARLVRDYHVAGFHVFGSTEPVPPVLLDPSYGTTILGQPLAAASLLNRLQAIAAVPLLNTADFETGVGFRIHGATAFPRQMAMAAAGDERLVRDEARITGIEARALGVQVTFAPVADVNDNPRNPVINTRSYGEDPSRVAALVNAYLDGAKDGGVFATLKHFPGHGDTDVDSHIGLPLVGQPRERLDRVELAPFRAGIAHGAPAVMAAHILVPALDPAPGTPATLSAPMLTGVLRGELGFGGLVYTDSLKMEAVTRIAGPGEIAVRAVLAGADQLLDSADPIAVFEGVKAAVQSGRIPLQRLDASVERVLRAKAAAGLNVRRTVDLDAVPALVGGRAHGALAAEAAARSLTLVRDDRHAVPLPVPRSASILYLSVLDYPSGWRIGAPSRTLIPELKKRWPDLTAVEVSDHTPLNELNLVRAMLPRYGAIVASVFVRAASGSGRLDLPPELVRLLEDVARSTAQSRTPFVAVLFGNPYVAAALPDVPAALLTYDFYDLPELAVAKALAGEAPIGGRLPITLSPSLPAGFGLDRAPTFSAGDGRRVRPNAARLRPSSPDAP